MKTSIIIILLIVSSLPLTITPVVAANVPAPEFVSMTPDGSGSFVVSYNTTVTITYTADRFAVDGVILLGTGSNLTTNYNEKLINFTAMNSHRDKTTYELNITITSYTVFYAYAWSGSFSNGTTENFENFDGVNGHQVWVQNKETYPVFSTIQNAEARSGTIEYYAPLGKLVTIIYTSIDPFDNQTITLSLSDNETGVFNSSLSTRVTMTKLSHESTTNTTTFGYNYTINQRLVFFTAFNIYGWERKMSNPEVSIVHRITNGFSFSTTFSESISKYTDIDYITLNLTSYNESNDDEFYFRYQVLENKTSDNILVNWTSVSFGVNISYTIVNDTNNYNTTEHIYQASINQKFNVSQVVKVQAYVKFKGGMYNESDPVEIEIHDSRPNIKILSRNETYTNEKEDLVKFEFSNVRGDVLNASIVSNYTASASIKSLDNFTIGFTDNNGDVVDGTHVVTILVFNTLNRSRSVNILYYVDTIPPTASFNNTNPTTTDDSGFITIHFSYEDVSATATGIKYATLDWGDGLVMNATGLKSANHQYRNSTAVTLNLTVFDMAGNSFSVTFDISVVIKENNTSTTNNVPIELFPIMSAIISIIAIIKKRKKN